MVVLSHGNDTVAVIMRLKAKEEIQMLKFFFLIIDLIRGLLKNHKIIKILWFFLLKFRSRGLKF